MFNLKKSILYFIIGFLFIISNECTLSCKGPGINKSNDKDSIGEFVSAATTITKNGNTTTIASVDTNELKKYLTFRYFKPDQVKFHFNYIDNSGSNDRISVPGPSDFYLEAVLYFDTLTFKAIAASYRMADWVAPKYNKEEFNFDWLDKPIKDELLNSDSNYHGHVDLFFTMPNDKNCHIWMLNKKLMVHWISQ